MAGKHAEVSRRHSTSEKLEGRPERGMSEASNELDVGVESERMSQTSARHGIAFPRSGLNVTVVCIVERDLIRLRPDDSTKRPVRTRMRGVVGRDG